MPAGAAAFAVTAIIGPLSGCSTDAEDAPACSPPDEPTSDKDDITMEHRTLGSVDGLDVSAIGLGCMSFTGAYDTNAPDRADAIAVIRHAVEIGVTTLEGQSRAA